MTLSRMAKFAAAIVGAVFVLFQSGITADGITGQEWLQIAVSAFGAAGVWLTANYVAGSVFDRYAKFVIAAGTAGLSALAGYLVDEHLSSSEVWNIIIAVVTAIGVGYFENDPATKVQLVSAPPHG